MAFMVTFGPPAAHGGPLCFFEESYVCVPGSTVYLEARYNWIDADSKRTGFLPLAVGFRW